MAKKYGFRKREVLRIKDTVRAHERTPIDTTRDDLGKEGARSKAIVVIKVTAACSGAKKWEGIVQTGGITPDDSTWNTEDLEMPEDFEAVPDKNGEPITEPNCYVVSVSESPLEVNRYYPCVRFGTEPGAGGASELPIFIVLAAGSSPFTVKITKDGGSAGTSSTAASWTYTVKDLNDTELGTAIALYRARAVGITNFASADSYGLAQYIGGTLYLLDAYKEYRGKATC